MKLSLQSHEEIVEIAQSNDDIDIHEMIDLIERLLIAAGFSSETVKDGFTEKAFEIEQIVQDKN